MPDLPQKARRILVTSALLIHDGSSLSLHLLAHD